MQRHRTRHVRRAGRSTILAANRADPARPLVLTRARSALLGELVEVELRQLEARRQALPAVAARAGSRPGGSCGMPAGKPPGRPPPARADGRRPSALALVLRATWWPCAGRPGRPIMPPICFIIFCASAKRLSSWLTSMTVTPEPLAMRARREPLMIFGLVRSPGVIERMIAVDPVEVLVVELGQLVLHLAHARHHAPARWRSGPSAAPRSSARGSPRG